MHGSPRPSNRWRDIAPIAKVDYLVTEDAASELQRFQAGGLHITETLPPQPLPLAERAAQRIRLEVATLIPGQHHIKQAGIHRQTLRHIADAQ